MTTNALTDITAEHADELRALSALLHRDAEQTRRIAELEIERERLAVANSLIDLGCDPEAVRRDILGGHDSAESLHLTRRPRKPSA